MSCPTKNTPDVEAGASSPAPFSRYTKVQKNLIISLVSMIATLSGFASNIYFPSLPTIAADLSVSVQLVNLTVTSYMVFQALSPTVWGAISDVHGRRVTYLVTLIIFLGACIGLAEIRNYAQLVVLRCVQSIGSASTIAIGAGVIGDITTREERGGYMGYFQAGLLLPVAIGPLIGGAIADGLGWRAIFWFLTIYSAVILSVVVIALPETLRSLVGNGSIAPKGLANSVISHVQQRRNPPSRQDDTHPSLAAKKTVDLLGALRILTKRQATFSILFVAIYYMVWQATLTVVSTLFKTTYGLTDFQSGLVYIANGVGCILGTVLTGKALDLDYRRMQKRYPSVEGFPLEKARLRTVWVLAPMQCATVLIFGWALDKGVQISVPIICLFFLGWAAVSIQSVVSTFLVDIYSDRSASATASLNLVRCILGAGGTAFVAPCTTGIGIGWTFTLFAGIMLVSVGLVLVQMVYGPSWRLDEISADNECM